jgi:hypothetical protein
VEIGTARCQRLQYRFLTAARDIDPDLWDSDRYDVLTSMTWRVLRIACHLIAHPSQWSEEHGYSAVRSMSEAIVQMRWMVAVEGARPTVWHEFKDYGRGRTKALKLHTEAAIDEQRQSSRSQPRGPDEGTGLGGPQHQRRGRDQGWRALLRVSTRRPDPARRRARLWAVPPRHPFSRGL